MAVPISVRSTALIEQAGWKITATESFLVAVADISHGQRSLLVAAVAYTQPS